VKRGAALGVVALLCAGVVALLVIERSAGAGSYGTRTYVDPCTAPADAFPPGEGLDGALQRITLSGLNGAACELGTSREALVLSFAPESGVEGVTWDRRTTERALRKGFERAIDDAEDRGTLPGWGAAILRLAVDKAPIDWLLGQVDLGPLSRD
jgi:hypothetical protein